jgi:hypothetical protein
MRKTIPFAAVFAITLVLGVVGGADAGGGGFGNPGGLLLFQCYDVQQGQPPLHEIEINDQFTDPASGRVGQLKIVCTPADFSVLNEIDVTVVDNADHLTCYNAPQVQPVQSNIEVSDAFGVQRVDVRGASRMICVQASKVCLSGCPVVSPAPAP